MIKRIFKSIGLLLFLLLLVIAGTLGWALSTEKGLQQTLAIAKKFAPGDLEWQEAKGKLAGRFNIRGLRYADPDVIDAQVGNVDFAWRPRALLGLELGVDQLHLDDIDVRLVEPSAETEPTEPASGELPDISLPASVKLADVVVSNVSVFMPGQDVPIELDRFALAAQMDQSDLQLEQLDIIAPQGEIRINGQVTTRDAYPLDLAMSWTTDVIEDNELSGKGTISGDLSQLQIDHSVQGMALATIAASVTDVTTLPAWDATIDASVPDPTALSPLLLGKPQISLVSRGSPDEFTAKATVDAETTETGPVSLDADVSGSTQMLIINSLVTSLHDNAGEISAQGQIMFATLQSEIEGQWTSLAWPVSDNPDDTQIASDRGNFDFAGTPEQFEASLSTAIDGELIPQGQWNVSAEGSSTGLDTFAVQGRTLDGTIDVTGSAGWSSQPVWDIELKTAGINPGIQWPELPGNVDLAVNSSGQVTDEGPQLVAHITQLSGDFRDQLLSGGGTIEMAGTRLNIDKLNISHGSTQLDVNGQVDQQIALDFDLSGPDLQTLLPELSGAISVSGSVTGSWDEPLVDANGSMDSVAFAENRVEALTFSVNGGPAENAESTLSVEATGIEAGGQKISDVSVNANGNQSEHTLVLSLSSEQGNIDTQLEGGYQTDTWNGVLSSLQLENTLAGTWRLREPTTLSANEKQAQSSALCLDNSESLGGLCVTGNWLAEGNSTATLTVRDLSPEIAAAYLPPDIDLNTRLDTDATATLGSGGDISADARISLQPGKITVNSSDANVELGLEQTTIDASWKGNDATFKLLTAITDFGNIDVQGAISDPAGAGNLSASLNADFADLTLLSTFVPQIQQVSGALTSDLVVSGTLKTPIIEGQLALRDFNAEIPETAMLIEDTELVVEGSPGGSLQISGSSVSGQGGQLDISGSFNPASRELQLNVAGEQYEVANTALMQAVVSPDLDIAMSVDGMQVTGEVTIPRVYVNANGGNEGIKTVKASSDVVFVSEDGEELEPAKASPLTLDVQVILGDSIEIEAGDFRGRIEGDLRIQQTPEIAPRGTGTINVANGDYVIYGQTLEIERGKVLFSGGPVDNPTLDMQVARTVQEHDVVAGARIKGTAQAPLLELYSEPSMPDASILSFILVGQPPGSTGLSYTLGRYLTPELYVSYGIGLFDAINTFNMRYSLTDSLALEAESGNGSSTDLIYTIER